MNDKLIAYTADKTISARHYIANRAAEKNLELARRIEGFDELYGRKKESEIALSKLNPSDSEYLNAKSTLDKINAELSGILEKKGLSLKSLEPKYYCAICGDTGLIHGKTCKCKRELVAKLRERALGESENELPPISEVIAPEICDSEKQRYEALRAKLAAFCDSFPTNSRRFLVFVGRSGTGKTYLAKSMTKELEKRGFDTVNISAFALNNLFLKYHTSFDESLSETFNAVISCDALVIDDLGTEPSYRNVTKEYLTNLINERSSFGKLTVVTTNLSPDMIASRYDERAASRLFDKNLSRTIPFDFADLRKK